MPTHAGESQDRSLSGLFFMKTTHAIYWTTTSLVCLVMAFSAINFNLPHPFGPFDKPFPHLGLPDYLRIELTVAKALGVLALLIPAVPRTIKEFAYFGFGITLISAGIAHFSTGDPIIYAIDPLIFLCVLIVSYVYFHRINRAGRGSFGPLPGSGGATWTAGRAGRSGRGARDAPGLRDDSRSSP